MGSRRLLRLSPVILLLTIAIAGCARTRTFTPAEGELPAAFPHHTLSQIRAGLTADESTVATLRARAALTLASPDRSGTFSSELRMRRDDSLYLSISPGLGIEAVRLLVTPDSAFVYDRIDNRVRYGSSEDAAAMLPVPIGMDVLASAILGRTVPDASVAWRVAAEDDRYVLTSPANDERYVVDPTLWRVVSYERRDSAGRLVEERRFEDYSAVDDVVLPRRLVFQLPEEETTVVLTYRDIDVNPSGLSFDLRVRNDARWTPVGE